MNPLDYFFSYYGASSWKDIVLSWGGTGTSWSVYRVNDATPIYTGSATTLAITSAPSTRGDYELRTTVGGTLYTSTIVTYTTDLPTPRSLAFSAVTATTASLSWTAVAGATGYEIADVARSYAVVASPSSATLAMTGLTPSTRYSRSVRTVYGSVKSAWSAPVTFFTSASTVATPGVFTFTPTTTYTWTAGRAGSTDPAWLSTASDWYAGDGYSWGDSRGVMTTYFFYGSPNQFTVHTGGTCTAIQVYVDRNGPTGDPGVVLSRWSLHSYYEKPGSQPDEPAASTDVGQFSRGDHGWVDLPVNWGQQLIDGVYAYGIAWGGTPERYQSSLYADLSVSPRLGDLRITVA